MDLITWILVQVYAAQVCVKRWWYARLRRIDMELLWPVCLREAPDLDHAKAAFAIHAFNDPAWLFLGEDEIIEFIDDLTN